MAAQAKINGRLSHSVSTLRRLRSDGRDSMVSGVSAEDYWKQGDETGGKDFDPDATAKKPIIGRGMSSWIEPAPIPDIVMEEYDDAHAKDEIKRAKARPRQLTRNAKSN